MSETSSKQNEKAPAPPAIESPEKDELEAEELDKVAGGMKPNVLAARKPVRLTGDPCDGGE